jgi:uncharacterized protein YciI
MFIVLLTYKKPIEEVDQYLVAHRAYLDQGYAKNFLLASGPKIPRNGGVLISQLRDRAQLESFLQQDPFYIHEVGDFEIIEFEAFKHHKAIDHLL